MFGSLQEELVFAQNVTGPLAKNMRTLFLSGDINLLYIQTKPDGTPLTRLDLDNHYAILSTYGTRNVPVVSEEGGAAVPYGTRNSILTDPVDSTRNLIERMAIGAPTSTAAISLALVLQGAVMGVVEAPLLAEPLSYTARIGSRAYRNSQGGSIPLTVSQAPRGIVLISDKETYSSPIADRLRDAGFYPLAITGSVFKALALVDPTIIGLYDQSLVVDPELPVVGFVSSGAHTHDYAATSVIVNAAGGVVSPFDYRAEARGCIMANTQYVYSLLATLMTT